MVVSTPISAKKQNEKVEKSKTGLRNSTQNGSIKAQRHSRSHANFDTEKQNPWKTDSKIESNINRGSRYHTNFEQKTMKQKRRTF